MLEHLDLVHDVSEFEPIEPILLQNLDGPDSSGPDVLALSDLAVPTAAHGLSDKVVVLELLVLLELDEVALVNRDSIYKAVVLHLADRVVQDVFLFAFAAADNPDPAVFLTLLTTLFTNEPAAVFDPLREALANLATPTLLPLRLSLRLNFLNMSNLFI